MKRLAASVVLLGLIGCPNWDDERVKQCRKINANTGVCVGLDGGAGGGSAGGGTGGGVAGGSGGGTSGDLGDGGVNALPVFPASQVLKTYVDGNHLRRPAFLWEVPGTGALMAVETRDGGFSIWRKGDVSAIDTGDRSHCASATNAQSTILGNAYVLTGGGGIYAGVDNFDGGPLNNTDYPLQTCPRALTQYRGDGGLSFLAFNEETVGMLRIERACETCGPDTSTYNLDYARIDEAVSDSTQTSWASGQAGAPGQRELFALEVIDDATSIVVHPLGDAGETRVELASSGAFVHAAWVDGPTLFLRSIAADAGPTLAWQLPESAQLIDLVENPREVVAVLAFSEGRIVILIHSPTSSSFHRIKPAFSFRPTVANLGARLRIAGQCLFPDGGPGGDVDAGCPGPGNNPVLEFDRLPDGVTYW